VKSEDCSAFSRKPLSICLVVLAAAAVAPAFCQDKPQDIDYQRLKWEKDFELVLEINNVPTKGQIALENSINLLENEQASLTKKKEKLQQRLEILNSTYSSDMLYDEMLEEETRDLASTKESISKKLAAADERLADIEDKLKKLNLENSR
jgi:chromosome segregation ATPase